MRTTTGLPCKDGGSRPSVTTSWLVDGPGIAIWLIASIASGRAEGAALGCGYERKGGESDSYYWDSVTVHTGLRCDVKFSHMIPTRWSRSLSGFCSLTCGT